jgi:flavorubredoxin
MEPARKVTAEAEILPSYFPVPGLGLVPVNAYVLKSAQPVLVDTGLHQDRDKFMTELESVVDPDDLTWLWLTHPDQDHVGSLLTLLERAPNIRIVTTFLGLGLLSLFTTITPDRIYLLNPGERLDVGDRTLVCMRPPSFDNPATTAFFHKVEDPVQLRLLWGGSAVACSGGLFHLSV